jgi:avermitilol synthase
MTWIGPLYCPFDPKVHPDAASVHEGSISWARSLGMLPTEQHVLTAQKAKVGWLVARAFPTARLRGLQVVADWTLMFCVLDDHVEKLGTADEVTAYLQHLIDLFRTGIAAASEDPFMAATMNLRQRLLALVSPTDFDRFADQVEELFEANVAEARNRERAQIPSIASYHPLREITSGFQAICSLGELLEGTRLEDSIREHPALRQLTTRASHIVGWANDLFTYEKDILQGQSHNLVLVLMNEHQMTVAEALAEAMALHDDEVDSFILEAEQLPSFGAASAGVQCYVEMLRCSIRGHLDWAHETGRYRPSEELGVAQEQPADGTVAA